MTDSPARPRRWVMWAGLVLFVVAVFGTRESRTSCCLVCRTQIESVWWGLTFGEPTIRLWRSRTETPYPPVQRFLGGPHAHGSAVVESGDNGPHGLFLRTTRFAHYPRLGDGPAAWIQRYPALADSLARRIDAGHLKAADLHGAITMELYDTDGDPTELTTEQLELLDRVATIIGEELQMDAQEISFRRSDLWRAGTRR